MKLFWSILLLTIYGFVFLFVMKEAKPTIAHGWVNSDPFVTLRELGREMKGNQK